MSKKGKGASKGKSEDPEVVFLRSIRESLPEAAKRRALPRLGGAWNVPIKAAHEMSSAPGVAFVHKEMLPQ
eukprot:5251970-Amphidinium_carterae.1